MHIHPLPPCAFHLIGQRDYQQDCLYPTNEEAIDNQRFCLVCDGVGGSECGELASQIVSAEMTKLLSLVDWDSPFTPQHFKEILTITYKALDSRAKGIDTATTLALTCIHSEGCLMAHIGDSRIYQFRPGEGIVYKSEDHTLVNAMVRDGRISSKEALAHPDRDVITRCMQPLKRKAHDSATVRMTNNVKKGDLFLLCSDGVTDEIGDDTLCEILLSTESCKEKVNKLATLCDDARDNATAILMEVYDVTIESDEMIFDTTTEVSPEDERIFKTNIWTRIRSCLNI